MSLHGVNFNGKYHVAELTVKTGQVWIDNRIIGTVKKVEAKRYGFGPATNAYQATTKNGDDVGTFDRRKDAIQHLAKATAPTHLDDVKVVDNGDGRFVSAGLYHSGAYFGISRYGHETDWTIDFYMSPGAFCPRFSNGAGTRVTRRHVLPENLTAFVDSLIDFGGMVGPRKVSLVKR